MQAYAASPSCATSRYSTLTGRYASRSAVSRSIAVAATVATAASDDNPAAAAATASVTVPTTKLEDVEDYGNDCSRDNIAVQFRNSGYTTGMFGKWHLSRIDDASYTYDGAVDVVKGCGFDTVGSLYVENLAGGRREEFNSFSDGTFSHNMEHMTYEAIQFINDAAGGGTPFFAYFNPTVPHGANSIDMALSDFSCRDTPQGRLAFDPVIPGMVEDGDTDCDSYRNSIKRRADSADDYGPIWLDDSVGALLQALEDNGILDNTIFVFQEDHGQETKNTLYETGLRIPQFVYSPGTIPESTLFVGPVSTIDVGPTMLEFAGIMPSYDMDGRSWKASVTDAIIDKSAHPIITWSGGDPCIFFDNERDRSVRCGCYKYILIDEDSIDEFTSTTYQRGGRQGLASDVEVLFNLCDEFGKYATDPNDNKEAVNLIDTSPTEATELKEILQCHIDRTAPSVNEYRFCGMEETKEAEPEKPKVIQAPAVTDITNTSAVILFQTSMAAKARIMYSPTRRGLRRRRNRKSTRYVRTRASNDFAKTIKLVNLKPGRKYWYRIFVQGGERSKRKRSFTTLRN